MKKYFLILIFFLSGVVSCSRLDIAVNWADTYIVSQVNKYFDLRPEQSKELKIEIRKDIQRVRQEQFPKWAKTLRDFEKEFQEKPGLSKERFHHYFLESLEAGRVLVPYFTDTALAFISTTTPAQLNYFEKAFHEKNIKDQQKIQSGEKARYESRKKYLRWSALGIDSLTKEQIQLLDQHLSKHPFPLEKQLKNKTFILSQFTKARKSPEQLTHFVTEFAKKRSQFNSPEYQQALSHYQRGLEDFVYQLLQSLSDKQMKYLRTSLLDKAALLEKMASKE